MKHKVTQAKVQMSEKKLKMHIKLILCTLKNAMEGCDTYEEFKEYINTIFKEEIDE